MTKLRQEIAIRASLRSMRQREPSNSLAKPPAEYISQSAKRNGLEVGDPHLFSNGLCNYRAAEFHNHQPLTINH